MSSTNQSHTADEQSVIRTPHQLSTERHESCLNNINATTTTTTTITNSNRNSNSNAGGKCRGAPAKTVIKVIGRGVARPGSKKAEDSSPCVSRIRARDRDLPNRDDRALDQPSKNGSATASADEPAGGRCRPCQKENFDVIRWGMTTIPAQTNPEEHSDANGDAFRRYLRDDRGYPPGDLPGSPTRRVPGTRFDDENGGRGRGRARMKRKEMHPTHKQDTRDREATFRYTPEEVRAIEKAMAQVEGGSGKVRLS